MEQEQKMVTKMETFTLFPDLPIEIRLKIWRSTFPGRDVGIQIKWAGVSFGGWMVRNKTPPPPMALQICHESREEALKHYILSFGTGTYPPSIYFNYEIDTLCFGDGLDALLEQKDPGNYLLNLWQGKSYNPPHNRSKVIQEKPIRRITLDVDDSIFSRPSFCWNEIRLFEGLEELLVIAWDSDDRKDETMEFFGTSMNMVAELHPEWVVPKTQVISSSGAEWGSLKPGQDASVVSELESAT